MNLRIIDWRYSQAGAVFRVRVFPCLGRGGLRAWALLGRSLFCRVIVLFFWVVAILSFYEVLRCQISQDAKLKSFGNS